MRKGGILCAALCPRPQGSVLPCKIAATLDELNHALGGDEAGFSELAEDHLNLTARDLVGCTNVVEDALQAIEGDSLIAALGSAHNFLLEAGRHFLRVAVEQNSRQDVRHMYANAT